MKLNYIFYLLPAAAAFLYWHNNALEVCEYKCTNSKLPEIFTGYRILHISDLHNKNFHGRLINKMKEINPDIIVITGDLIDRRKTNLKSAEKFIEGAVEIAPTYYVSGNHEQLSEHYAELKVILNNYNVINLDDSYARINKSGSEIGIVGIAAPVIMKNVKNTVFDSNDTCVNSKLKDLSKNIKTDFNMLIAHRPEQIHIYKKFDLDLILCGHAHGGQIRIPFIGGILAPNQGFFPKYSQGIHKEGSSTMVISRGLGNSSFPFRIFNRPEIVVIDLESKIN